MSFTSEHKERFFALLRRIGFRENAIPKLWDTTVAAYAEPLRKYHTATHIIECLKCYDEMWFVWDHHDAPSPIVELALWWHDLVYRLPVTPLVGIGNEELSASFASHQVHTECGPSPFIMNFAGSAAQLVYNLVLATTHTHAFADYFYDAFVVDVDMAILAADDDRFAEYEQQIFEEYCPHPRHEHAVTMYRMGRSKFLQSLLDRHTIFLTDAFQAKYEARAEHNVRALIERLQVQP